MFEVRIPSVNGKDMPFFLDCPECRTKSRNQKLREAALAELEEERKHQREVWKEECNLPPLFVDKTFDNFDRELQPRAYDVVKGYSGKSIVLLSPDTYGVGKTHLVAALVNHLISTKEPACLRNDCYSVVVTYKCPAYFTTEAQLLSRIRATYNRDNREQGETEEDIYRQLDKYDLLIVDDVGKVRPRDYSFLQGVYFRVIDNRYVTEQPIILTTNLSYNELEAHIGGACADRLIEMCGHNNIVLTKGKSYRSRLGE